MKNVKERVEFAKVRPLPITLSTEGLIELSHLAAEQRLPLVVRSVTTDVDLVEWARSSQDLINQLLIKHGGILFRGFHIRTKEDFARLVNVLAGFLMDYIDPHTPRTALGDGIYTSTEYPPSHRVPFHSENSKNKMWPTKLWFFCLKPAEQGGETPIADNRKVYQLLDPALRRRFEKDGVMYVRNYGDGLGLSWQTAFRTTDKRVVEDYCRRALMRYEWKDGDRLRLSHQAQAVFKHPVTGEMLWFNQAHLFHPSSLQPEVRSSLLSLVGEENLPSNAYYGDGSPIEDSVIETVCEAYERASSKIAWQSGDVLMLENMLVAHGRAPFRGERKVLVAMAQPHAFDNVAEKDDETAGGGRDD